ncbi:MAG TPA: VOC family protein [Thermomicrobiales bacterium]|jgi:catechol 2,3-dioxygenase|nr:VOC family protein [Thermomicrobiales bacterium]
MSEPRVIQGLGEIGLRVNDLERMADFYEHVIGLERWQRFEGGLFFRIADGFAGHTRVLGLFDRRNRDPVSPQAAASTLDHFAFEIPLAAYASERQRLEGLGLSVRTRQFPAFHWRALFVEDPEGNTVELVCYDPSV